ncbi:type VII secretion protein EccE [Nocardia blacklockiae]|uniref:type VII secretion protein EccE n=1 Tax=Nocardia blacklockiae TaxID=480036 RepID=UPI001893EC05|nr:type VII secretion protein EccE [Nocardia blacklockiae]MBF6175634.1 type VII secretion protein EccE [Nocardia blacklockiae]
MSFPSVRVGGVERGPFATLVVGGGPVLAGLSTHTPWWVLAVAVCVLVAAVTVRFGQRTAVRWLLDWVAFRTGRAARARRREQPWNVRDVQVAAGVCGVHEDGATLVAMIQLAPDLDLPTVIAEQTIYTEDTIGLDALLPLLDQYGIGVDIDIVTTGQRVRPGGSYSMLYDQLLGSHPVVGNRMSWLVVRLDQERNLHALTRRGPCEVVAPKALASAAHRIATRLRERGINAQPLPADALWQAARLLHAGVELSDLREKWNHLESSVASRSISSFMIDWSRLGDTGLDDCWSWNRGRTTVVVSLAGGAVGARGLVRYVGPAVTSAPVDYLLPLGGRQSAALLASLPTGTSVREVPADEQGRDVAAEDVLSGLTMAIGPNGQILGSISGQPRHTLALPLFDPSLYNPQRRTIDVRADLPVAQQIVLRAMVVGADVEVYSARPQRWEQLVSAVGDPTSLRLVSDQPGTGEPPESSATVAVFDQVPPRASAAPTTVTISDPGQPRRRAADLAIDQVSASAVDVGIPMRTVRVDLIEPRGETRYFDYLDQSGPPAAPESPIAAPGNGYGPVPPVLPPGDRPVGGGEVGREEMGR